MMTSMDDFFNIAVPRAYLGVSQFVKLSLTFPNGYWWFGLVLLGAFLDLFVQLFTFFICYIHILGLGCISMSMWCRALTPDKYHRQPWHVPKCGCDASYFLPRIWYMLRYVCFFLDLLSFCVWSWCFSTNKTGFLSKHLRCFNTLPPLGPYHKPPTSGSAWRGSRASVLTCRAMPWRPTTWIPRRMSHEWSGDDGPLIPRPRSEI